MPSTETTLVGPAGDRSERDAPSASFQLGAVAPPGRRLLAGTTLPLTLPGNTLDLRLARTSLRNADPAENGGLTGMATVRTMILRVSLRQILPQSSVFFLRDADIPQYPPDKTSPQFLTLLKRHDGHPSIGVHNKTGLPTCLLRWKPRCLRMLSISSADMIGSLVISAPLSGEHPRTYPGLAPTPTSHQRKA